MLTAYERTQLQTLIGRQKLGWLTPLEEQQMRRLIAKEYPAEAGAMTLAGLVLLGLGILAAWALLKDA